MIICFVRFILLYRKNGQIFYLIPFFIQTEERICFVYLNIDYVLLMEYILIKVIKLNSFAAGRKFEWKIATNLTFANFNFRINFPIKLSRITIIEDIFFNFFKLFFKFLPKKLSKCKQKRDFLRMNLVFKWQKLSREKGKRSAKNAKNCLLIKYQQCV